MYDGHATPNLETGHVGNYRKSHDQDRDGQPGQFSPVKFAQDEVIDRANEQRVDDHEGQDLPRRWKFQPGDSVDRIAGTVPIAHSKPLYIRPLRPDDELPHLGIVVPTDERVQPGIEGQKVHLARPVGTAGQQDEVPLVILLLDECFPITQRYLSHGVGALGDAFAQRPQIFHRPRATTYRDRQQALP